VGDSFTVLDLEVQVTITHTWVGDLCVTLSKDGGGEVTLIQRMFDAVLGCDGGCCGCSANNLNVTLDDDAGSSINDQCADNLVGTFTPDPDSLAGFIGGGSAGNWTINVADNAGADLGTLNSWGLVMTAPAGGGTPCEETFPDLCVTNEPPDCSAAVASAGELWPPFHDFHDITVEGVTDPDGDAVSITITAIFQDESINGQGDGDTCPDGTGVGTSTASVRAERSGLGDGRVYHIFFTADDGNGGTCDGSVTVCVPHDQGQGSKCGDQGPSDDSTDCGNAAASNSLNIRSGRLAGGSGPASN
jgi:subtilisin-like proprotein convertase family protein